MPKPTKKKRSESEAAEKIVVQRGMMLREAACAYAAVADLGPSDPRWQRCWRALELAAFRLAEAL